MRAPATVEPFERRLALGVVPMMLTNTFAWRRSRVTSTPVTVTKPRRADPSRLREERCDLARGSLQRRGRAAGSPAMCRVSYDAWSASVERARHFLGAVALDDVADLDVVEVLDADTALVAFLTSFTSSLKRRSDAMRAVVHLDAVANDAHACPGD